MENPNDRVVSNAVWINPERMGGAPCFLNTRIPIRMLFEQLRAGGSIEEFLEAYSWVERAHVQAVMQMAEQGLDERLAA